MTGVPKGRPCFGPQALHQVLQSAQEGLSVKAVLELQRMEQVPYQGWTGICQLWLVHYNQGLILFARLEKTQ